MAEKVEQGDKRSNGAVSLTVVDVDSKYVYVKGSDESKKALADREGAHRVSRSEFLGWNEEK